jgi:hypothetical protein
MKYSEAEIKTLRSQWMAGVPAITIARGLGRTVYGLTKAVRRYDLPARGNRSPILIPERRHAPIAVAPDRTAVARGQTGAISANLKRSVERDREGVEYVRQPVAYNRRAWEPLPATAPVSFTENTGCKWPVGEHSPYTFCNAKRTVGRPYCEAHQTMAYHPRVIA